METERTPNSEASSKPSLGPLVARHTGGSYKEIRAKAKRRRLIANAIVVGSTAAVLVLAAVFNAFLSR